MITQLELVNFKSHKKTILEISPLTVLCGSNAVGKSSAIQALLLLRESYLANSEFKYLDLKSNPINIGSAKDAIYQFAEENEIGINIIANDIELNYLFWSKDSELSKTMMNQSPKNTHVFDKDILGAINVFSKTCQFISAARLGPQPYYQKDDVVVGVYNQISVIEGRAEHFVHYLMQNKDLEVIKEIQNPSSASGDLFYQTAAWEREISKGVNINVIDLGNVGYELQYEFKTESTEGKTNSFKSNNVGFGLSYVMPIIVAILSAPPEALILIENPEAHIHPNGQAKLAELICIAAQAGIQIIVETHSDHIINGILVQSKRFETDKKGIDKENVAMYQFIRNEVEHSSEAIRLNIGEEGNLYDTPKGFFDQFTIDRKYLLDF